MTPRTLRPLIRAALLSGARRPPGIPRRRWARELRRVCRVCGGSGLRGGVALYAARRCPACDGEGWR